MTLKKKNKNYIMNKYKDDLLSHVTNSNLTLFSVTEVSFGS